VSTAPHTGDPLPPEGGDVVPPGGGDAVPPEAGGVDPAEGGDAVPAWAGAVVAAQPYPVIFATVSGAHLYGFASVDSDLDLRGVHLLPAADVVGLRHGPETVQGGGLHEGTELDLVTHDLAKFCRLLLRRNGYVLEQLLSPLVVHTTALHDELRAVVPQVVTRHHAHHYLGFAATQWQLFGRTGQLKPALYTLRVLLTGLHLVRTGEVVADLSRLADGHDLPYVPELIAAKRAGEHRAFTGADVADVTRDVARLRADLERARDTSPLPERPDPAAVDALHDLLVRARLGMRA
jgi:hypothetical protein